ncbi:Acid phosphatase-like protein 2 [Trachymyrmex zeteki]|uniref:2-phosphoxylose phosphatase 1 n=1 Tax=Mycetomoellerius zeteki TaxID=64791 RepID=A0A151WWW8_9HYME|nr:Acid phosphatase-like protein 2 [Trachymyrmex zeteki]
MSGPAVLSRAYAPQGGQRFFLLSTSLLSSSPIVRSSAISRRRTIDEYVESMYKYIGVDEKTSVQTRVPNNDLSLREFPRNLKSDAKTKKIFRFCNLPHEIAADTEGKLDGNLTLSGILIFIRHGDRGPLTHIRNISSINCGGELGTVTELETIYENYVSFVQNASSYSRAAWAQFLGPFHGLPVLPANTRDCRIGQLTTLGILQLLKTGIALRNAYYHRLNLGNGTSFGKDVIVYSTSYRRTVQSAVALLYALFENDGFQSLARISLQESQSYAFCSNECACPAAEKFLKQHLKIRYFYFPQETSNHLKSHPAVGELIKQAASAVFELPDQAQTCDPNTLRDALLTYVCHGSSLPCADLDTQRTCVKSDHVTGLFAYTDWESKQIAKSSSRNKYGLLKAYGMLRGIVTFLLRIISEARPKIVLYSGHDKTLEYLATALGIVSDVATHYASRLVIEVYKINPRNDNRLASDFYFRIVANGRDLTPKVPFCRNANTYVSDDGEFMGKKRVKLCPIETIVRQLHDDYFVPFNATNFKDACSSHKIR